MALQYTGQCAIQYFSLASCSGQDRSKRTHHSHDIVPFNSYRSHCNFKTYEADELGSLYEEKETEKARGGRMRHFPPPSPLPPDHFSARNSSNHFKGNIGSFLLPVLQGFIGLHVQLFPSALQVLQK